MPHSSGGGSHGGGSHGGSHGGRGSSVRTSKTYFPGASRYVYYHNGVPAEIFSNVDPKANIKSSRGAITAILIIMGIMYGFMFTVGSFHFPHKLDTDYNTAIYISDTAHIMSDRDLKTLMSSLEDFQSETGITPCVYTVCNEDWDNYKDLEKYAYDLYVNKFEDEKHWLIVYSQPDTPDEDFNDWYWEGMQGDDTDNILNDRYTGRFNKNLQKMLLQNDRYTVAEAISEAFDDLTPVIMTGYINWALIIVAILIVLSCTGGAVLAQIFMRKKERTYEHMIKVEPTEILRQANCDYCGGVYIVGHHTNCPHCQAQITPENVL